ncbi:MAG: hypothetical protein M0R77_01170 [Gammaproteobacteria bacterium]|nr:hypothetical protein [Acholeplasmataceae bacterium]MCK9529167.1 hypothetical protein [Gammaproteobacteria bacterium]
MRFTITSKLSVKQKSTDKIILPGFIHQYSNELTPNFLGISTNGLFNDIESSSSYCIRVIEERSKILSQLTAIDYINCFDIEVFKTNDLIVEHKLIRFDLAQ